MYAPPEAPSRLAALYAAKAEQLADTDLSDTFEFLAPPVDPVQVGAFEIRAVPVDHLCPTWGLRIEAEGRVFAFTGDTGPSDGIAKLAAGADVVLSEESWLDSPGQPSGMHLSGKQAGAAAASAGVGKLLLTHYSPWTVQEHSSKRPPKPSTAPRSWSGPTPPTRSDHIGRSSNPGRRAGSASAPASRGR
ncbi:MBL fold metallo-hydrolase [Saccharopolyspora hattusasensis]|uniref:MBL fold metallo-hydrolase n=1 Tax=Saccharopolyspora hattusasensis TaxID=1128679 RepID=UPI003D96212E